MNFNVRDAIESFITEIRNGNTEIYNEFSLQHELGIHLRSCFPSHKVQFERNINYFEIPSQGSPKREIDISIYNPDSDDFLTTIELKFLNNGQTPNQMFKICEDMAFMEHSRMHKFKAGYVLVITDDKSFYEGSRADSVPYCYFRSGKTLAGTVKGSVGQSSYDFFLQGSYHIVWHEIDDPRRYTLIEIA